MKKKALVVATVATVAAAVAVPNAAADVGHGAKEWSLPGNNKSWSLPSTGRGWALPSFGKGWSTASSGKAWRVSENAKPFASVIEAAGALQTLRQGKPVVVRPCPWAERW